MRNRLLQQRINTLNDRRGSATLRCSTQAVPKPQRPAGAAAVLCVRDEGGFQERPGPSRDLLGHEPAGGNTRGATNRTGDIPPVPCPASSGLLPGRGIGRGRLQRLASRHGAPSEQLKRCFGACDIPPTGTVIQAGAGLGSAPSRIPWSIPGTGSPSEPAGIAHARSMDGLRATPGR